MQGDVNDTVINQNGITQHAEGCGDTGYDDIHNSRELEWDSFADGGYDSLCHDDVLDEFHWLDIDLLEPPMQLSYGVEIKRSRFDPVRHNTCSNSSSSVENPYKIAYCDGVDDYQSCNSTDYLSCSSSHSDTRLDKVQDLKYDPNEAETKRVHLQFSSVTVNIDITVSQRNNKNEYQLTADKVKSLPQTEEKRRECEKWLEQQSENDYGSFGDNEVNGKAKPFTRKEQGKICLKGTEEYSFNSMIPIPYSIWKDCESSSSTSVSVPSSLSSELLDIPAISNQPNNQEQYVLTSVTPSSSFDNTAPVVADDIKSTPHLEDDSGYIDDVPWETHKALPRSPQLPKRSEEKNTKLEKVTNITKKRQKEENLVVTIDSKTKTIDKKSVASTKDERTSWSENRLIERRESTFDCEELKNQFSWLTIYKSERDLSIKESTSSDFHEIVDGMKTDGPEKAVVQNNFVHSDPSPIKEDSLYSRFFGKVYNFFVGRESEQEKSNIKTLKKEEKIVGKRDVTSTSVKKRENNKTTNNRYFAMTREFVKNIIYMSESEILKEYSRIQKRSKEYKGKISGKSSKAADKMTQKHTKKGNISFFTKLVDDSHLLYLGNITSESDSSSSGAEYESQVVQRTLDYKDIPSSSYNAQNNTKLQDIKPRSASSMPRSISAKPSASQKPSHASAKPGGRSAKPSSASPKQGSGSPRATSASPKPTSASPRSTSASPKPTSAPPRTTSASPKSAKPTSASPRSTSASPKPTSASPRTTSASPIGTSASPRAASASPRSTSASTKPTSAPPRTTSASPKSAKPTSASPRSTSTSPIATSASPRAASASPRSTSASPKPTSALPRTTSASPKSAKPTSASPRSTSASPIGTSASPRAASASPRSTSASPKPTSASLRATSASPKSTKPTSASPRSTSASPRSTSASPRAASASPRATSASPRSTSASPRAASASPRSTSAFPRATSASPKSTKPTSASSSYPKQVYNQGTYHQQTTCSNKTTGRHSSKRGNYSSNLSQLSKALANYTVTRCENHMILKYWRVHNRLAGKHNTANPIPKGKNIQRNSRPNKASNQRKRSLQTEFVRTLLNQVSVKAKKELMLEYWRMWNQRHGNNDRKASVSKEEKSHKAVTYKTKNVKTTRTGENSKTRKQEAKKVRTDSLSVKAKVSENKKPSVGLGSKTNRKPSSNDRTSDTRNKPFDKRSLFLAEISTAMASYTVSRCENHMILEYWRLRNRLTSRKIEKSDKMDKEKKVQHQKGRSKVVGPKKKSLQSEPVRDLLKQVTVKARKELMLEFWRNWNLKRAKRCYKKTKTSISDDKPSKENTRGTVVKTETSGKPIVLKFEKGGAPDEQLATKKSKLPTPSNARDSRCHIIATKGLSSWAVYQGGKEITFEYWRKWNKLQLQRLSKLPVRKSVKRSKDSNAIMSLSIKRLVGYVIHQSMKECIMKYWQNWNKTRAYVNRCKRSRIPVRKDNIRNRTTESNLSNQKEVKASYADTLSLKQLAKSVVRQSIDAARRTMAQQYLQKQYSKEKKVHEKHVHFRSRGEKAIFSSGTAPDSKTNIEIKFGDDHAKVRKIKKYPETHYHKNTHSVLMQSTQKQRPVGKPGIATLSVLEQSATKQRTVGKPNNQTNSVLEQSAQKQRTFGKPDIATRSVREPSAQKQRSVVKPNNQTNSVLEQSAQKQRLVGKTKISTTEGARIHLRLEKKEDKPRERYLYKNTVKLSPAPNNKIDDIRATKTTKTVRGFSVGIGDMPGQLCVPETSATMEHMNIKGSRASIPCAYKVPEKKQRPVVTTTKLPHSGTREHRYKHSAPQTTRKFTGNSTF